MESNCTFASALVPPLQYSQRPQRVPAAGRSYLLQFKIDLALVTVLQAPAAIFSASPAHNFNGLSKALIAGGIDRLKTVQRAKDIIMPPRREREAQEFRFDDFSGSV